MPYSSPVFDKTIAELFTMLKPATLLDLGAGAGKYGAMIQKVNDRVQATAVELEKEYIKRFKLHSMYSHVWHCSVMDLISPRHYEIAFDVIMIGDILEHLRKSEGIDLLNFLIYRCKWVVVVFPHRYLQNAVDGHDSEAHISVWNESDFFSFERTDLFEKERQRLIVLRGYLEKAVSIEEVASKLRKR